MMGPDPRRPAHMPRLGYHLTVDVDGYIVKVIPDFDYPKGDLGSEWPKSAVPRTVKRFVDFADFDDLVIHTPKGD